LLIAFGEPAFLHAKQPSSQATSTLGYTQNLYKAMPLYPELNMSLTTKHQQKAERFKTFHEALLSFMMCHWCFALFNQSIAKRLTDFNLRISQSCEQLQVSVFLVIT